MLVVVLEILLATIGILARRLSGVFALPAQTADVANVFERCVT